MRHERVERHQGEEEEEQVLGEGGARADQADTLVLNADLPMPAVQQAVQRLHEVGQIGDLGGAVS